MERLTRVFLLGVVLLLSTAILVVGVVSGTGIAEAHNGVAAIKPESPALVGAGADVAAGQVGFDTGLFDDFVSGCCVAPRCRSFSADTQVLLGEDTATTAISELEVGDEVWDLDPAFGESGPRQVEAVWPHWNDTDQRWQESQHIDRVSGRRTSSC